VDADENGIVVFIGISRTLFERDEGILGTCHQNPEAPLLQQRFGPAGHIQRKIFFPSQWPHRSRVVPPVPGVKNHRANLGGILDFSGTQDGLDDLGHIHRRENGPSLIHGYGEAEDVLDAIDEHFLGAGPTFHGAAAPHQTESTLSTRGQFHTIETSHVRYGDMPSSFMRDHIPFSPSRSGKNSQQKPNCQRGFHQVLLFSNKKPSKTS
jgi:hypothetical protein